MQILFRNRSSNMNFLKAISGVDEMYNHISDDIIESESEYIELIEDICEDLPSLGIFGKYKN
ncbi:MAG: hypothetical protein ACI9CD_000354 [Candidatus Deianiraeaceae bacterium]|jgi:hypothetical protein